MSDLIPSNDDAPLPSESSEPIKDPKEDPEEEEPEEDMESYKFDSEGDVEPIIEKERVAPPPPIPCMPITGRNHTRKTAHKSILVRGGIRKKSKYKSSDMQKNHNLYDPFHDRWIEIESFPCEFGGNHNNL